jgi:hypothetical protein
MAAKRSDWVKTLIDKGDSVPINLKLPWAIHNGYKKEASDSRINMSELFIKALSEWALAKKLIDIESLQKEMTDNGI